ncbi:stage II sporulation protein M [Blautia sp. XA-2221]|uniref:stage II sporulation protein M n=1 Tax=Blautia sp. XA-2221 TaxID=2903961 RepID=UPI002378BBFB|nr:stage II sporulation protein M [Blautia sp. XA-2221]
MKKRLELYRRGRLPVYWLFFFGFFMGVIIPNVMWKYEWHQKTAASLYLLAAFADSSLDKSEYFWQVLKMRGNVFLISALCGVSVFGAPLAVMGILYMGVRTGLLLTMSILQFGLQGGIVGLGAMFPQYLLYFPCFFWLMWLVYRQSLEIWKSRGLISGEVSVYALRVFLCTVVFLGGVLLETWCNPPVMEVLMKSLDLF